MTRRMISVGMFLLLTAGCSSLSRSIHDVGRVLEIIDEPTVSLSREAPKEIRQALNELDELRFTEALATLDQFLQNQPTSPWTQSAFFHRGRGLEGLGRPSEAAQQYSAVVRATEKLAPKLQAMSLYRLSFCYEAMGEDQLSLATLHDLLSRTAGLPKEVSDAELPARLAGAYARVGNFDKAVSYYRTAEVGINRLRRGTKGIPQWLPQTLYSMGSVSARTVTWDDFETALRPISRSQIYLLQAAELGFQPWADLASHDLIATYAKLWRVIETPPEIAASEPVLAQRTTQDNQLARAEILNDNLKELKARSLATEAAHGTEASKAILQFANDLETKIARLFRVRKPGEGLTAEARARRAAVRGKTITNDDSLEQKFLKSSRSNLAPATEDPNL